MPKPPCTTLHYTTHSQSKAKQSKAKQNPGFEVLIRGVAYRMCKRTARLGAGGEET